MKSSKSLHLTALIADDEIHARDFVRNLLRKHDTIQILEEVTNGFDALDAINALNPDVVFMDINMPGLNGIQVVEALQDHTRPYFVLITAHQEYAVQAFASEAVDYLVKPLSEPRFDKAIERLLRRHQTKKEAQLGKQIQGYLENESLANPINSEAVSEQTKPINRMVIKENGKIFFVLPENVDFFEASGNYIAVHVSGKVHLIHDTLSHMEKRLDPEHFLRIHRSVIVNVDKIKELEPYANGEYVVKLENNPKQLKLSRNYRENAKNLLSEN